MSRRRRGCGAGSWPSAVAVVALVLGIVPWSTFGDALDALAVAARVPACRGAARGAARRGRVLRAVAASFGGTAATCASRCGARRRGHGAVQPRRRGRAAHAAYIHIARRHGDDPLALAFMPGAAGLARVVGAAGVEPDEPGARRSARPRRRRLPRARGARPRSRPRSSAGSRTGASSGLEPRHGRRPELVDRHALRIGAPGRGLAPARLHLRRALGMPAWSVAGVALGVPRPA